jgi:hypothetical protein
MMLLRVASSVLLSTVLGLAAAGQALAAPQAPGHQDALHEVMAGDNLHLIAGYYYGDARQWERIWKANKAQVKNPNIIERGMLLLIPDASAPETPYPEFAARARREAEAAAAAKAEAAAGPPEKEVRVMGEDKPAAPAETPASSPAAPGAPAPPATGAPPPAKGQPGSSAQ